MNLDTLETPQGAFKLGCLVPESFPTGFPCFADRFRTQMMTLDQVRAVLAEKPGLPLYNRRQRFAGSKYIRNQRDKGSCNGFSTAGVMSRMRELRGEPYVCLSGADAYSQMNGGRDNGSILADAMDKVLPTGIAPEDMVPWDHIYTHQISAEAKAARARFRGFKAYAADTEEELVTGIALGHMAVIAVHADNNYGRTDGDGVSYMGNGVGNHSVGADDLKLLSDGTICIDDPNSWGVEFGDGGRVWLTWRRHLQQTVKYHRFWLLVSTTDDEQDDSVPPAVKA